MSSTQETSSALRVWALENRPPNKSQRMRPLRTIQEQPVHDADLPEELSIICRGDVRLSVKLGTCILRQGDWSGVYRQPADTTAPGILNLSHQDPDVVKSMVQYLQTANYDDHESTFRDAAARPVSQLNDNNIVRGIVHAGVGAVKYSQRQPKRNKGAMTNQAMLFNNSRQTVYHTPALFHNLRLFKLALERSIPGLWDLAGQRALLSAELHIDTAGDFVSFLRELYAEGDGVVVWGASQHSSWQRKELVTLRRLVARLVFAWVDFLPGIYDEIWRSKPKVWPLDHEVSGLWHDVYGLNHGNMEPLALLVARRMNLAGH